MRSLLRSSIAIVLFFGAIHWALAQPATWFPVPLASGSPILFTLELPAETVAVTARWQNHTLVFFGPSHSKNWYGLAGVDVETNPGDYPLAIEATLSHGRKQTINQQVHIESASYQEIPLTVPDKFVSPSPADLKRIASDQALKTKAFAKPATKPASIAARTITPAPVRQFSLSTPAASYSRARSTTRATVSSSTTDSA